MRSFIDWFMYKHTNILCMFFNYFMSFSPNINDICRESWTSAASNKNRQHIQLTGKTPGWLVWITWMIQATGSLDDATAVKVSQNILDSRPRWSAQQNNLVGFSGNLIRSIFSNFHQHQAPGFLRWKGFLQGQQKITSVVAIDLKPKTALHVSA